MEQIEKKQFTLLTMRAHGAFGAMIKDRALDGSVDETITIEELISEMNSKLPDVRNPLVPNTDYFLRPGVTHVHFIARKPEVLDVQLPEPAVFASLVDQLAQADGNAGTVTVRPPWPMTDSLANNFTPNVSADNGFADAKTSGEAGTYVATLNGNDAMEMFIEPYLGAYLTTQCF